MRKTAVSSHFLDRGGKDFFSPFYSDFLTHCAFVNIFIFSDLAMD